MNTSDFINNAEYLIRQCLNQPQIDPLMKAWLQDACLDLAKAREKYIQKKTTRFAADWIAPVGFFTVMFFIWIATCVVALVG